LKIHLALFVAIAAVLGPAVSGAATPPVLVPAGVSVAGVDVSGMRPDLAQKLVYKRFNRPIRFVYGRKTWEVPITQLTGGALFRIALDRALDARAGADIQLPVVLEKDVVHAYVDGLADLYDRPAVNAKSLGLVDLRPAFSSARYGLRVKKDVLVARIMRNLIHQRRVPIEVQTEPVAPTRLRSDFNGPTIVIRRLSNTLYLYKGSAFWRSFGVATGQSTYPTPTGAFHIVDMQRWPWWYPPPDAPWAKGAQPIPPGPGNPLGTRWMGLSVYGVGIHGTPDDASIGYSQSHGCIRMHIPDAEWLFGHVQIGTPVYIVDV
jgi:lipoprotein-anchoring transpeptidase ErfK/SrfK